MRILVTGCAGFIGYHLCLDLLRRGFHVDGIDSLNTYYDPELKEDRLADLREFNLFTGHIFDLEEQPLIEGLLQAVRPAFVFHLAAQAGVRYSLDDPQSYIDNNCTATLSLLDAIRQVHSEAPVKRVFFASSSSVYGTNKTIPFKEDHRTDAPANLYAATKKFTELLAFSYSHLFGIRSCGLRFFTVYGPWGRPDMALFRFVEAARTGEPARLFNRGNHKRDWTHIDDVVQALRILLDNHEKLQDADVFNISSGRQISLKAFCDVLQDELGDSINFIEEPMQKGDVRETFGDISKIKALGYEPAVDISHGIKSFVVWYDHYKRRTS